MHHTRRPTGHSNSPQAFDETRRVVHIQTMVEPLWAQCCSSTGTRRHPKSGDGQPLRAVAPPHPFTVD